MASRSSKGKDHDLASNALRVVKQVASVALYAIFRVLLSSELLSSSPTAQDCSAENMFLLGGLHAVLRRSL
jgi:hypothetical protein